MIIIKYLRALRAFLRVPTYLLMLLYLLLGFSFAAAIQEEYFSKIIVEQAHFIVLFAAVIALWYINGTALNDYADFEIDQINLAKDKDRPLVTGLLTKREVLLIAIVSGVFALVLAAVRREALLVTALLLILNWAYSLKPLIISRRGGLAPLMLPLGYVGLPVSLGFLAVSVGDVAMLGAFIGCVYLQFAARIVLKDYRDVKGDRAHGKQTFLLRYGTKTVCMTSMICLLAGTALLLVLFREPLVVATFPIVVLLGFAMSLLDSLSKKSSWKEQKPLISAIGRSLSGILFVLILAFVFASENLSSFKQIALYVVTVATFVWSTFEVLDRQSR